MRGAAFMAVLCCALPGAAQATPWYDEDLSEREPGRVRFGLSFDFVELQTETAAFFGDGISLELGGRLHRGLWVIAHAGVLRDSADEAEEEPGPSGWMSTAGLAARTYCKRSRVPVCWAEVGVEAQRLRWDGGEAFVRPELVVSLGFDLFIGMSVHALAAPAEGGGLDAGVGASLRIGWGP